MTTRPPTTSRSDEGARQTLERFVPIRESLNRGLDRKLGYCGEDRFVLFYYEPRGEEVMWMDSRRDGFGLGGWCVFLDHIAPLADRYGVDVGAIRSRSSRGACRTHSLVLDRLTGLAHFAPRPNDERFVASQGKGELSAA